MKFRSSNLTQRFLFIKLCKPHMFLVASITIEFT